MEETVRIGGGSVALGDSGLAASTLIAKGKLDFLILDYLTGEAITDLDRRRRENNLAGYVSEFAERVWAGNLTQLRLAGTRIVTNAGGLDPGRCCRALSDIAEAAGLALDIVAVAGPGAAGIAAALDGGADVVVTGPVANSVLTLGALVHAFAWRLDAFDQLAAGSLLGHIVECGAQAARGTMSDWRNLPFWARGGYPIAECCADGRFTLSKLRGAAGQCTVTTVAQHLLYEVGNPAAHRLPDVTANYCGVEAIETGPERVLVTGARGLPPSDEGWPSSAYGAVSEPGGRASPALEDRVEVPLFDIAWSRLGDEGDGRQLGVVARRAEYLPYIRTAMTAEAVAAFLSRSDRETDAIVERFELPGLDAMSFRFRSPCPAPKAGADDEKSAQRLLDFPVAIPRAAAIVLAG